MKYELTVLSGTIIDEEMECTLKDLCSFCNVSVEFVYDMINEGLIMPRGDSPSQWRFGYLEIKRIQTTIRLQRDLRVNLPGCALAIDLLEELEELRHLKHSL